MSDPIINGTSDPQFNREEIRFSPQSGEYSGRLEGPVEKIRNLIPQFIASGATGVFVSDKSPIATLDFNFGSLDPAFGYGASNEQPSQVWELLANVVEKNLLAPNTVTANYFTADEIDSIKRYIANPKSATRPTYTGTNATQKTKLLQLLIFGQESRIVYQPTVRMSKTVSLSYRVKTNITNAGKVLSKARLSADEAIPDTILFNLPDDTYSGGSGFTAAEFVYGWMKGFPTVQTNGANSFSISQEWQYGLWPTAVYEYVT